MRLAGHEARIDLKENLCMLLVGKPEGNKQLERPRRRWVDDSKIDIGEIR
jgi:hypothetical protein